MSYLSHFTTATQDTNQIQVTGRRMLNWTVTNLKIRIS